MLRITLTVLSLLLTVSASGLLAAEDVLIADFEADDYGNWTVTGEAFGAGPARGTLPGQMSVSGYQGSRLVNSYAGGDRTTGTLSSPAFSIDREFINFLIGGGGHVGETCMNLVVDGEIVRTATGPNTQPGGSEALQWSAWDVSDLVGEQAVIEIVDRHIGGWGHINVDHIIQSDRKYESTPSRATFVAEKRYLYVPIRTGATVRRTRLFKDGESVREMNLELAGSETPSFIAAIDLSFWPDAELTLDAGEFHGGESVFANLKQSDELPGHESMYEERDRPRFHFTSKIGWLNDPNGLVWHDGVWHLFYQHNPYGWNWGNMHWGHAVSSDLAHWTEVGDEIFPWSDCEGAAFSGCGVIDHLNTSGFGSSDNPPMVLALTDTDSGEIVAYSGDNAESISFYEGNPVVRHQGRDPKIIWHVPTNRWVMALYDEKDGSRDIAFYSSSNLKDWEYHSRIHGFFECPDLFPLPVDGDPENVRWIVYAADGEYVIGDFDGRKFTPGHEGKKKLWHGNFYAAQSYDNTPRGRRIQFGWARGVIFPGMPFNQQMTVPVELTLRSGADGPRLCAEPVDELKLLRTDRREFHDVSLSMEPLHLQVPVEALDLEAEFQLDREGTLEMKLRGTEIRYDAAEQTLHCGNKVAKLPLKDGTLSLRILVDRNSIEVFADHGQVAISHGPLPSVMENKGTSPGIELTGHDASAPSIRTWQMKSIWEETPHQSETAARYLER